MFRQRLVKRAALVHFRRAEEKSHFAAPEIALERGAQLFQRILHRGGTADLVVGEKICVLQPDEFAAAKKRERLQGLDRGTNPGRRLVGVVGAAVDDLDSEIARVRWRELGREFGGGGLDRAFIRADDGVDVGGFAGGFGFHQRVNRLKRFSKSAISENSCP